MIHNKKAEVPFSSFCKDNDKQKEHYLHALRYLINIKFLRPLLLKDIS